MSSDVGRQEGTTESRKEGVVEGGAIIDEKIVIGAFSVHRRKRQVNELSRTCHGVSNA